ncbi:MAG: flagellar hook-length control protein FliK [Spirochaetota bacterium]
MSGPGELTGGTAGSRGGFHSELEAALRRADVSPEGPDEQRVAAEAADQGRRVEDSPRKDVSRPREDGPENQDTANRQSEAPNPEDRNVRDDEVRDEKARNEKAGDKNAGDSPEAKAPSETSRNREGDTAAAKGEGLSDAEEAAEEAEAAASDKKERLLRFRGLAESGDGESQPAFAAAAPEDRSPKTEKLSPAFKSGGSIAAGVVPPKAEKETLDSASFPDEPGRGAKKDREPGLVSVRGNAEAALGAKGAAASNLSAREIPRNPLENGNRKGIRPAGEEDAPGDKDAGKNTIRTTVVSRSRNSGETDASGGRQSALQDFSGRSDPSVVKEASDGPRFDTPASEAARSGPGSANTSSLEGSRDVAPRHLQQQLKDFATGDVVRHARFVIRENAGGEIRLLLRPEQLGTVRVRLEVQDNRIAGRIIVENTTVRDAFEQTLSDLHRAFREAGLETGSLEVTVGEDGQASGRQSTAQGRRARAVEELAKSVPTVIGVLDEPRMISVYA